ncbi:MAG: glycine--tRNA ligase subunit beta [Adlercreutzia equolifaciens]
MSETCIPSPSRSAPRRFRRSTCTARPLSWQKLVPEALDAVRIPHGDVAVYTTPRRLIAIVADVAARDRGARRGVPRPVRQDRLRRGDGNPTKAATGFARAAKGVDVDALERREENGVEYVFAVRKSIAARDVARAAARACCAGVIDGHLVAEVVPAGGTTTEYVLAPGALARGAVWMTRVIPVRFAGLAAGHDHARPSLPSPGPHDGGLRPPICWPSWRLRIVVPSEQAREAVIREGVAADRGGAPAPAPSCPSQDALEVVNLSQAPHGPWWAPSTRSS